MPVDIRRSDLARGRHEIRAVQAAVINELRRIVRRSENSRRVEIGHRSYVVGGPNVIAYRGDDHNARVRIGNYTSIAEGVEFLLGGGHRTDWVSTFPLRIAFGLPGAYADGHPTSRGDILIGSDVWIGKDAKILGGVTIGHGAIVGAAAVVSKDVGAYDVVAGNPGRVINARVTPGQRAELLRLSWWDWPERKVRAHVALLAAGDVDAFLRRATQ